MVQTITAASGATTVTFRLYGEVSEARLQTETFLCQRRANQLAHVPKVRRREYVTDFYGDDGA